MSTEITRATRIKRVVLNSTCAVLTGGVVVLSVVAGSEALSTNLKIPLPDLKPVMHELGARLADGLQKFYVRPGETKVWRAGAGEQLKA